MLPMVYEGFWQSLPAIIKRLEEIQAENWQGSAEQRKKADKAAGLQNSNYNMSFVLRLAGMVDIYKVFRWIVNRVNELPHVKYDQFKASLEKMSEMSGSIEPWNCVCWSMAPNWPYPPPPGPLPADAERDDNGLEDYSDDGCIDEATEFRVGDDSNDDTCHWWRKL